MKDEKYYCKICDKSFPTKKGACVHIGCKSHKNKKMTIIVNV